MILKRFFFQLKKNLPIYKKDAGGEKFLLLETLKAHKCVREFYFIYSSGAEIESLKRDTKSNISYI